MGRHLAALGSGLVCLQITSNISTPELSFCFVFQISLPRRYLIYEFYLVVRLLGTSYIDLNGGMTDDS